VVGLGRFELPTFGPPVLFAMPCKALLSFPLRCHKILHPEDRVLFQMTGGRLTFPGLAVRLPVIMLTTSGTKTDMCRTIPLLGRPPGENLAAIAVAVPNHVEVGSGVSSEEAIVITLWP